MKNHMKNKLVLILFFAFAWMSSDSHFVPEYLEYTQNPFNSHSIKVTSALLNEFGFPFAKK